MTSIQQAKERVKADLEHHTMVGGAKSDFLHVRVSDLSTLLARVEELEGSARDLRSNADAATPSVEAANIYKALPSSENERNAAYRAAVVHLPEIDFRGWVWTNEELGILRKAGFSRHGEMIRTETLTRVAVVGMRLMLARQALEAGNG